MSGRLHGQLRCCLFCVLALLALQLTLVLLAQRFGHKFELTTSPLPEDLHLSQHAWREFIAHTPEQPDAFFQYNRQLSDNLPTVRALPVTRHESCNNRSYILPHATRAKLSVVISFYNEARSMLLRTILTLISRTHAAYLHELIIVDDASEDVGLLDGLKELLDSLYATRRRLKLLFRRNERRKGLIWSRQEGARLASGHYLLFLDSHCEVNGGWLEPLLERLAQSPTRAVSPVLDAVEPANLSYLAGNVLLKGGFDWSLHFHWLPRLLAEKEPPEQPFKSPAFAGGILMISRDWFKQLHGFNTELQIWGGESIELAIKLWLCGGQIEIVPCSRIGHIFRQRHAFEFPAQFDRALDSGQATYLRNSKIIAESWLDEYKYLFYALKPAAKQIPLNLSYDPALVKAERQCRPFDWFMRQVSPELRLQHANLSAVGTIRNADRCLHVASSGGKLQLQLQLTSCHRLDLTQWQLHRETGQLSTAEQLCVGVEKAAQLTLAACQRQALSAQRWQRHATQLVHARTHLCLDNPLKDQLALSSCRPHAVAQSFQFALEMEAQT